MKYRAWMNADGRVVANEPSQLKGWVELAPRANFEAIYGNQEQLAAMASIRVCNGERMDPVSILEIAQELYEAELAGIAEFG